MMFLTILSDTKCFVWISQTHQWHYLQSIS